MIPGLSTGGGSVSMNPTATAKADNRNGDVTFGGFYRSPEKTALETYLPWVVVGALCLFGLSMAKGAR